MTVEKRKKILGGNFGEDRISILWPEAGPRTKDGGFDGWSAKAWDKGRLRWEG